MQALSQFLCIPNNKAPQEIELNNWRPTNRRPLCSHAEKYGATSDATPEKDEKRLPSRGFTEERRPQRNKAEQNFVHVFPPL